MCAWKVESRVWGRFDEVLLESLVSNSRKCKIQAVFHSDDCAMGFISKAAPLFGKKNYICALISISILISLIPFPVHLICFCFLLHAFFLCPPHFSCYIIPWDDLTVYFFLITIQANNEKHMWKKTKLSCGLNGTRHLFSTQTWITLIIIKQRSLLLGNWGLVFTCLWLLHIPPS